jgi:hypothetical protein
MGDDITKKKIVQILFERSFRSGEIGIRTLGTRRYTAFPRLRFRPLSHLSRGRQAKGVEFASSRFAMILDPISA